MVADCVRFLVGRAANRLTTRQLLRLGRSCYGRHFDNEGEDLRQEARVPESVVNRRLTAHELNYANHQDGFSFFSANQVSVNRPVEDRWSVYRFCFNPNLLQRTSSSPPMSYADDPDHSGTVFTVVDGHGGHACAHTFNLLHCDYLVSGLLPPEISEKSLIYLRTLDTTHSPFPVLDLTEVLWSTPEAMLTGESEHVGMPQPSFTEFPRMHDPSYRWTTWGPWGPLPWSLHDIHMGHLRNLLEESLSCSFEGNESLFEDNDRGDICDPEGFIVATQHSIQQAVAFDGLTKYPESLPSACVDTPSACPVDCISDLANATIARLHDRVAGISKALRSNLKRLDLDLSLAAQPSRRDSTLDKALLRTVFSGCVTTTAYIPHNGRELYVTQVGDCGAVLGRRVPPVTDVNDTASTEPCDQPEVYSPSEWDAELLINPHDAENLAEVRRLKSSHPVHESDFILRNDRLLGELVPLRAFGDIRFKWPSDELRHVARLLDLPANYPIMPSFYVTPPYLCSTPQVVWRPLQPRRDHFLILATDGLWDMISAKEAVNVVARHWFDYQGDPSVCGPGDTAASRLIRTALGGETMDSERISGHFSLPATVARYYRDDITVIVVYLPTAFSDKV